MSSRTPAVVALFQQDLSSDPTLLALITANVDANQAVRTHPPLAANVKEIMRIVSREEPPEDFWANLFSWLVRRGFMSLDQKAESPEAYKRDILTRFSLVVNYDALRFSKHNVFAPEEEQQLANTLAFVWGNPDPCAINDALRRDLSNEAHPQAAPSQEWKTAVAQGWACMEAPPNAKLFEILRSTFKPLPPIQTQKGTLIERIRARMTFPDAKNVTWSQVRMRAYELTPRAYLVDWLKKAGCHPEGLLLPPELNAYFVRDNKPMSINGELIPKRALLEMFRMFKTRDVHTQADLAFLGYTLNVATVGNPALDTIQNKFTRAVSNGFKPPNVDSFGIQEQPQLMDELLESGRAAAALLSDPRKRTPDQIEILDLCLKWIDSRYFLRAWLSGASISTIEKLRDKTTESMKALYLYHSTCHDGLSQLHAFLEPEKLKAWARDQGHLMVPQDDPSSAAQRFCFSKSLMRSLSAKGSTISQQRELRNEVLTEAVNWHYLPKGEDPRYLTDDRMARLFEALKPGQKRMSRKVMWELIWSEMDSAPHEVFLNIARARLTVLIDPSLKSMKERQRQVNLKVNEGVEAQASLQRALRAARQRAQKEAEAQQQEAESVPEEAGFAFPRGIVEGAKFREAEGAERIERGEVQAEEKGESSESSVEQSVDPQDLRTTIAMVNLARAKYFQMMSRDCALVRLSEAERDLHLTTSSQLDPIQRGKSLMLQYSRMMEVYGGESCRSLLSVDANASWDKVLEEYFRTNRFVQ